MSDSSRLVQAAIPSAPLNTTTAGPGEVKLDVSTTAVRFEIPTWMAGRICDFTFTADVGSDPGHFCDVLEGNSAVDAVAGQVTTVSSEELVLDVNTGRAVVDGTTKSWRVSVSEEATHMSVEATEDGILHISTSSDPVRV